MMLDDTKELSDIVIKLSCGSVLQHGKYNDRIYLIKLSDNASDMIAEELIKMALDKGYSKIFAKLPENRIENFINTGYSVEAFIPGFYNRGSSAFMLCYYITESRRIEKCYEKYNSIRGLAVSKMNSNRNLFDTNKFLIRKCCNEDISSMAKIYSTVFSSYPFPIHDRDYLIKTMQENVDYYCAVSINESEIVALASAEIDYSSSNAEMTDFATLPDFRGNNLAIQILNKMEKDVAKKGIKTFYTIARAVNPGINITFAKSNYRFGGRLKNNTNISGQIESMNIWYK